MFTNNQRQEERTGKNGTPRLQYLQELVSQFQNATEEETKERIVANLANFAYDPYNYTILRQLNVLELFIDCITEPNEKLVEFGIGGICNACAEPKNAATIVEADGIPLIIKCLSSPVRNTVNYALGALYYMCDYNRATREGIMSRAEVVDLIKRYAAAESVSTNLNTRFIVLVYNDETISSFKENLCKEHKLCFPQFGEITISALEVEREGLFYHLPDSLILSKAFYGISKKNWFLRVDVLGVQEDMVTITPADQTCPNPHLLEENTEITKDLTLAQVAEEQEIIKRNMESMDTKRSQKKSSIDLNQSANATELCATEKDVHHMDEVKDVQANQTDKKDLSDLQKGVKKDLAPALQLGDGVNESHEVRGEDCVKDNPDDFLMKPITKDIKIWERIEVGEGSKSVTIAGNNRQVADSNSSLTTAVANEKKRKRTKRDTKQPTDVAKENGEMDAVDAKSVKKKKSRKAKTLAQEDTLVASAGQNVNEDTLVACEAMKATDI